MSNFDLASLDTLTRAQSGVPMSVIHPRDRVAVKLDETTTWTITLCGRSSDAYRAAMRVVEAAQAERAARGVVPTPEDMERENTEILTACTRGWTPFLVDGIVWEYSVDKARALWSDRRFQWLREQGTRFVRDDANFLA